jgi:hypothetical protein
MFTFVDSGPGGMGGGGRQAAWGAGLEDGGMFPNDGLLDTLNNDLTINATNSLNSLIANDFFNTKLGTQYFDTLTLIKKYKTTKSH